MPSGQISCLPQDQLDKCQHKSTSSAAVARSVCRGRYVQDELHTSASTRERVWVKLSALAVEQTSTGATYAGSGGLCPLSQQRDLLPGSYKLTRMV